MLGAAWEFARHLITGDCGEHRWFGLLLLPFTMVLPWARARVGLLGARFKRRIPALRR